MIVRSIVVPLDEMMTKAAAKKVEPGVNVMDWFFANEVPPGWRLIASSILLQPSRVSALLQPGQPSVTPVFYFFFEEAVIA
jgi:hypothetical protein